MSLFKYGFTTKSKSVQSENDSEPESVANSENCQASASFQSEGVDFASANESMAKRRRNVTRSESLIKI